MRQIQWWLLQHGKMQVQAQFQLAAKVLQVENDHHPICHSHRQQGLVDHELRANQFRHTAHGHRQQRHGLPHRPSSLEHRD